MTDIRAETARTKQQDYLAQWKADRSAKANDIWHKYQMELELGPLDPERRESTYDSYLRFGQVYFPEMYFLPFAPDHLEEEELLKDAIMNGAWFAFAEPRGTGKTTRSRTALVWGVCHGHIDYGVYIGATAKSAARANESILKSFVTNDLLREDFPEVCLPFAMNKGKAQKAVHQVYKGEPAYVACSTDRIATAYMPDIEYSNIPRQAVIDFTSIGGEIRGRSYDCPDGTVLRPKLAIADDPQTREVAKSPTESQNVLDILKSDVAYMAGPREKMGLLIPCTIIEAGDAADRMLDRQLNPKFHGRRVAWFISMPTNMGIWEKYRELMVELQLQDTPEREAAQKLIQFYNENKEACEEGAEVFWEEAYNPDEFASAIHKGAHLWLEDADAFMAEYQNLPFDEKEEGNLQLKVRDVMGRTTGLERGVIPEHYDYLTAMIDVQQSSLWWAVTAFKSDMSAAVVDYGVFPDQQKNYVTLRNIKKTMRDAWAADDLDYHASVVKSLEVLLEGMLKTEWKTEAGVHVNLEQVFIDCNYHESTQAVFDVCKDARFKSIALPSQGVGTTARKPSLWTPGTARKKGERRGHQWRTIRTLDAPRLCQIATNHWKTIVAKAWHLPVNNAGAGCVFGKRKGEPWVGHQAFAENMCAEQSFVHKVDDSQLICWELETAHADNHWWDCVVGCYVAANMLGCTRPGMKSRPPRHKPGSQRKVKKTLKERLEEKRRKSQYEAQTARRSMGSAAQHRRQY